MDIDKTTKRLKKAHVTIMSEAETCLYTGIVMMGNSYIDEDVPTAYTDGKDCVYGKAFVETLTDAQLAGLVLHEKLHIILRHPIRLAKMFKENPQVTNMAADFAANLLINDLKTDKIKLPPGALLSEKYRGWSVPRIYDDIMQNMPPPPPPPPCGGGNCKNSPQGGTVTIDGKEYPIGGTLDEHDFEGAGEMTPEEIQATEKEINEALHQGSVLAGRRGVKMPRAIRDMLTPTVDWRDALRDFWSNTIRGKDEFTWKTFDMRRLAMGLLLPTNISETVGEVVVAIDTSGSIGGPELAAFASELVSLCEMVSPSSLRVLWWDTQVHGEQLFAEDYSGLVSMLKPQGGGGTTVSCVNEYLNKNSLQPEAVIIFTDGYVEGDVKWTHSSPTLWLITQNKQFKVPSGHYKVVKED
jgi:predicted metal-dependent peptidase